MDQPYIVDNKWNTSADFTTLRLPYSIVVDDSIIAILKCSKCREVNCLMIAYVRNNINLSTTTQRNVLKTQCKMINCPYNASINMTVNYPRRDNIRICNSCYDMIFLAKTDGVVTTSGDYMMVDERVYVKCKYTWPNVHKGYNDQALKAYVNYHAPLWFLINELRELLPRDVTAYIMQVYLATYN